MPRTLIDHVVCLEGMFLSERMRPAPSRERLREVHARVLRHYMGRYPESLRRSLEHRHEARATCYRALAEVDEVPLHPNVPLVSYLAEVLRDLDEELVSMRAAHEARRRRGRPVAAASIERLEDHTAWCDALSQYSVELERELDPASARFSTRFGDMVAQKLRSASL